MQVCMKNSVSSPMMCDSWLINRVYIYISSANRSMALSIKR